MPALQQVGQLGRGHRHFAQSTPPPLLAIPLLSIIVKLAAASVCTSAAATRMDLWRCASVSQCRCKNAKSARCNGWNGLRATSLRKAPISGTRGRRRPLRRPSPLDLPVLRKGVSYCLRDAKQTTGRNMERELWPGLDRWVSASGTTNCGVSSHHRSPTLLPYTASQRRTK